MNSVNIFYRKHYVRKPDKQFASFDDLYTHAYREEQASATKWIPPADVYATVHQGLLKLKLSGDRAFALNDWSFSQLCSLLNVEHSMQDARLNNSGERRVVRERLTKEIAHWDNRAQELKAQEDAGRTPNLNSRKAQERADELQARMQKRLQDLEEERKLSPQPPVVIGGTLVIPIGLLRKLSNAPASDNINQDVIETKESELLAMSAVMTAERALGHEPRDVSADNCGYDIESRDIAGKRLRFIEVKGRAVGADTVTLTRNEIVTGVNASESFILAIVPIRDGNAEQPVYVRTPFEREPDFGVTTVNYKLNALLARGGEPS